MHLGFISELPPDDGPAQRARAGDAQTLAAALTAVRARSLRVFQDLATGLAESNLQVPQRDELNPPLWELGHIGWFEAHWIARNPARLGGPLGVHDAARARPLRAGADGLYNSSVIAHERRWNLALPDLAATLADLARGRDQTLALLAQTPADDNALYPYRLVLLHECMHAEAWQMMAQALGIVQASSRPRASPGDGEIAVPGGRVSIGSPADAGFAFDNEIGAHEVVLAPFHIDACAVSWERFLPFVDAGGYQDPRWWSTAGQDWLRAHSLPHPRFLRGERGQWQRQQFGRWHDVDPGQPAVNLCVHEAQAWCAWAGRRLPTEFEWECAATQCAAGYAWGEVWEWTASAFTPYPGFVPHLYRDYSAPWFDGRPVLRGASFATAAELRSPRYRNYFTPERNDVFAGFRSCRS